jgi:hypothetical protein
MIIGGASGRIYFALSPTAPHYSQLNQACENTQAIPTDFSDGMDRLGSFETDHAAEVPRWLADTKVALI